MKINTHLDHISRLSNSIWYILVEWMDLPNIYHEYSPRLDLGDSFWPAVKVGVLRIGNDASFGVGGVNLPHWSHLSGILRSCTGVGNKVKGVHRSEAAGGDVSGVTYLIGAIYLEFG